jgi:hypothetical protein
MVTKVVTQGIGAQGLLHKLVTVVTPGIGGSGWSRIAQGNGDIGCYSEK